MTYGDGVGNVDIAAAIEFHRNHGKAATLTAVYPAARFGALDMIDGRVMRFSEKPKGDGGMVNGGFFVLSPKVLTLIEGDTTVWEREPLQSLAESNELMAYEHNGFWQPMDTLRDKIVLEKMWETGTASWKVWD